MHLLNTNIYHGQIAQLSTDISRSISPENPNGAHSGGCHALPEASSPAASLGKHWKARPFIKLAGNSTSILADICDSGIIQSIWCTGELDRSLILRIYWDGSDVPSVECPLTDFFLYGYAKPRGEHWNAGPDYRVNSLPICVNPNRGLNCYIPMPFASRALFTLENRNAQEKCFYYQINYSVFQNKNAMFEQSLGYFHARYQLSKPVMDGIHTLLELDGCRGHYLGTALYVGLNRNARWWGEGEMKFYLDGDHEYPTICFTGLEDYFGGAYNWDVEGSYQTYSTPYAGVPHIIKPDGLYSVQQRFCLYRWHLVDPIRFSSSLRVTMQDLGWGQGSSGSWEGFAVRRDDMSSVAYWYQEQPTTNVANLPCNAELWDD